MTNVLAAATVFFLFFTTASARAAEPKCLAAAGDTAQIAALRAVVDAACPCSAYDGITTGQKRRDYQRCAKAQIAAAVTNMSLRTKCKGPVSKLYAAATCGRPPSLNAVVCIRTDLVGRVTCRIKNTTKANGTPNDKCIDKPGAYTQVKCPTSRKCIDAADSNGDQQILAPGDDGLCNPTPTPTPTNTATATETFTPTPTHTPLPNHTDQHGDLAAGSACVFNCPPGDVLFAFAGTYDSAGLTQITGACGTPATTGQISFSAWTTTCGSVIGPNAFSTTCPAQQPSLITPAVFPQDAAVLSFSGQTDGGRITQLTMQCGSISGTLEAPNLVDVGVMAVGDPITFGPGSGASFGPEPCPAPPEGYVGGFATGINVRANGGVNAFGLICDPSAWVPSSFGCS